LPKVKPLYINQDPPRFPNTMLQIIDDAAAGGAENHTRLIAKEFARRGYRILLISPPGPFVEQFKKLKEIEGVDVDVLTTSLISKHYMNPFLGFDSIHLIKAIRLLRDCIREKQIQIIHSHKHPMDFLVALAAHPFPSVQKITTIHGIENKEKFWAWRWWRYHFIRKSLMQFNYVFTVSESVRRNTIRYFSLPPQKVVTVMNGIDLSELKPDLSANEVRRRYKVPPDHFVILCVGKLEYRKGQDILLRAVATILKSGDFSEKISVLLVGSPHASSFQKKLRALSEELRIEKNVVWVSYEPNVSNILQIADLYVQPSRSDALPRALIEAMGMGVCSIGSDVDGIPEIIEHEKTGLLFENENTEDLARQIKKVLAHPEKRKFYGDEAIKKVKTRHTASHMVDKIEEYIFGGRIENRS
jgi:glycosyltransferase involved in cell wall biosynthesis